MRWPQVEIERLCLPTFQRDPRQKPEESFVYIDISSIDKDLKTIVQPQYLLGSEAPSRARKVIRTGDILVSTVRPNLNTVALVPKQFDWQIASTGFCVLRTNPDLLNNHYLFYRTLKSDFVEYLTAGMRGANYPAVTDGVVKEVLVPLPPPSEQRRIVEILDQADALRRKRTEADTRAERILPALFIKMFGDPASNPRGWKIDSLGSVIEETQYGTSTRANEQDAGVAIIRMNNIDSSGRMDLTNLKYVILGEKELEKYKLEQGDLLFNRTNSAELVGKTGLWTSDLEAVPASYLIRFRVNTEQALSEYIWAYMNTPFIKQLLFNKARRAIGMANINAQELRALPLVLPDIELQHSFALKIEALNLFYKRRSIVKNHIEALFQLLLYQAFSGDLTAKWREVHMQELLAEMEEQARLLNAEPTQLSFV